MTPAVLEVEHKGRWKMVGKVFAYQGKLIFQHEESGNQRHFNLDSPGGIDTVILHYLLRQNVIAVYHTNLTANATYCATPGLILKKGERRQWDGRDRTFLPTEQWIPAQKPTAPWIQKIVRVDWSDVGLEHKAMPTRAPLKRRDAGSIEQMELWGEDDGED